MFVSHNQQCFHLKDNAMLISNYKEYLTEYFILLFHYLKYLAVTKTKNTVPARLC